MLWSYKENHQLLYLNKDTVRWLESDITKVIDSEETDRKWGEREREEYDMQQRSPYSCSTYIEDFLKLLWLNPAKAVL